jgi:hypothetical protein
MKLINMIVLIVCAAQVLNAQDVKVNGNTKLNTDFSKYKTYTWASQDPMAQGKEYEIYSFYEEPTLKKDRNRRNADRYIYSYNVIIPSTNQMVNTTVQDAIASELEGRGYTQSANGDLVVAYRVLEGKGRMKGYKSDNPTMVVGREVRQPSDTATYTLEPGTLVVSLIDRKTSEVVWDGFASGLYQQNAFVSDATKLKSAVHLMMEEFKYRGDKLKVSR